jgi:hypothetical protein
MAMISTHNFLAPFKNKTHLFSIIVVAAVFGLWRATGGAIAVRTKSPSNSGQNVSAPAQIQSNSSRTTAAQQPARNIPPRAGSANRSNGGMSDLDALLSADVPRKNPSRTGGGIAEVSISPR